MFDYIILVPLFPLFGAFLNGLFGVFADKWGRKFVHAFSAGAVGIAFTVLVFFIYQKVGYPVLLVSLIPALGGFLNVLFGYKWNKTLVHGVGVGSIGLSFILSSIAFYQLIQLPVEKRFVEVLFYKWMVSGDLSLDIAFLLDPLSMVMMLVVTGVSFLIHVYSIGYMHDDPSYARFFSYLNLFVFFMLILVMGNNFPMMFVGWEGVGLCSYLLIGFWFEDDYNAYAGNKAFIVNRIGDYGFLLGMFLIFVTFHSLNYSEVFENARHVLKYNGFLATAITLLLFMGATGKSAQIPLYVWLPDAMAGPTPVSALIHAATMVTAGVYMVARCNALFTMAPVSMAVVATVGAVTALFAASMGFAQRDIKRILAYSTISQLGYMFLAVGVGAFAAGIFHLVTHAFFKALLFLSAGSVIHAMGGEQDVMKMGGLRKYIPATFVTAFIATLAIAGVPGFSGFFSKDEILWYAFSSPYGSPILWLIGAITAGMTAFYMFRWLFLIFFGEPRMDEETKHHIHESPKSMLIPLFILAVLSVVGGYINIPEALGGKSHLHHFLEPITEHAYRVEWPHYPHFLEYALMIISVTLAFIGFLAAYWCYVRDPSLVARITEKYRRLYTVVYNKYFVDEIYNATFVRGVLGSAFSSKKFDEVVIDGAVNGTGKSIYLFGALLSKLQTGYIYHYIWGIVIGVLILLM
ncbi:NADH-quinone oxidoreductase subunit L [Thermodesulforhabdus norvegica]|uniref:NADH dehydrogenase subunit L n=1 Tax=Thermodesulforhabdus norvegica TaxID=39841 RepID=A0A1I4UJG8_9BACT|nr:NADH-quinone oxidoreductase subunit L [Thermodesulforhabdus norvegica]SFM89139.1 NADH dehydrogenase subunit L [Thermodesulforhabdus norvegica]